MPKDEFLRKPLAGQKDEDLAKVFGNLSSILSVLLLIKPDSGVEGEKETFDTDLLGLLGFFKI